MRIQSQAFLATIASIVGTLNAPLAALDKVSSSTLSPPATIVFAMVDGGRAYVSKYRRDGFDVHVHLEAVMRSIHCRIGSRTTG